MKVGGVDVRDYDLEALRNQVAVVLQKNVLFSGTIKDNLRWGDLNATDEELVHACQLAQADEFIQQFPDGYDTCIEQGGANVSGGQKQRLCIARALLKHPKILILDDSTTAVDTTHRRPHPQGLPGVPPRDHQDHRGPACGQRCRTPTASSSWRAASIAAIGNHQELLASNPIYQEIYESQNKGGKTDE